MVIFKNSYGVPSTAYEWFRFYLPYRFIMFKKEVKWSLHRLLHLKEYRRIEAIFPKKDVLSMAEWKALGGKFKPVKN